MAAPYQSQRGGEGVLESASPARSALDAPALDVAPAPPASRPATSAGCASSTRHRAWDSALLVFVRRLAAECAKHDVAV
jgi:hypothetical protein